MTRQRHGRGVLCWAVLTAKGSVHTVLGPHMVLKGDGVDKTFLTTDLTLVNDIAAGASPLVELMVVPLLEGLITGWTVNLLVSVLLLK